MYTMSPLSKQQLSKRGYALCFFGLVTALFVEIPLPVRGAMTCPDSTWVPNAANTRCFKSFYFSDELGEAKASWLSGMHMCSNHGAPLATIHTPDEDDLVRALTSSASDDCWIGLRKYKTLKPEKGWLWIDRQYALQDTDFLNWGPEWKSIWKFLPPDEKCGTYQSEGWGNRPCVLPGSKLPCFVCATIDPQASEGAQLAYANNFNTEGWWSPSQVGVTNPIRDGWGDGTNILNPDWASGSGGDVGIVINDLGDGVDIPWNPIDPRLIPSTTTTTTRTTTTPLILPSTTFPQVTFLMTTPPTPSAPPVVATTVATAAPIVVKALPAGIDITTAPTPTMTIPTTTTTTAMTSTTTAVTTTSTWTSVKNTVIATTQPTRIPTVVPPDETNVRHNAPEVTPDKVTVESSEAEDNRSAIIGLGIGVGVFVALILSTAGVILYRYRRGAGNDASTESSTEPASITTSSAA